MIADSKEQIREMEPEFFLQYISEMNEQGSIFRTPAEHIARALLKITTLYNQAARKELGPGCWVCGTFLDNKRKAITQIIRSRYSNDQLNSFIEVCRKKPVSIPDETGHIFDELLSLRPKPCVLSSISWRSLHNISQETIKPPIYNKE